MSHPFVGEYRKCVAAGYRPDVSLGEAGVKGLGVFAGRDFKKDEAVEFCHSFVFEWQSKYQRDAMVGKYCYGVNCHCAPGPNKPPCLLNCPANGNRWVMPMGYGACYNSAESEQEANAAWMIFIEHNLLVIAARTDISKGSEILTWFGQGYFDSWCKK